MKWRKRNHAHPDKPDVEAAKAELERVRAQRDRVEALVEALRRERHLNSFTANTIAVFRGGGHR